ncbi:secreted protein [Klebsiella pneumoniae subsp. ozaenae]|uniref:Secreted protein n=1 Tax=Klebsiella pneumoniae subsp. ozaenae TaxID=574 RepID=A0A378BG30_KLEPO|nr:secreted protein [Klebsiella pneumoniae subsp. ozaenae]
MFALVLFICYLDGGCEDIVVDVYREETQCLVAMEDQRIRPRWLLSDRRFY